MTAVLSRFLFSAALGVPSLFVTQKYLGWTGAAAYVFGSGAGLACARKYLWRRPVRGASWLTTVSLLAVMALFVAAYPLVNTNVVGIGSDDDDAHDIGAHALLRGRSPYTESTYLGNVLHQLPGAFVLAIPFVMVGTSALQNVFWLAMFVFAIRRQTADAVTALRLLWCILLLSPTVLHQLVTGTTYLANTIYVVLGLWWLVRTQHVNVAGVGWGIGLASRANFLLLLPLAFMWLLRQWGIRQALLTTGLIGGTVAALSVPFYALDPGGFGPLEAADRLTRFDSLIPYGGVMLVLMTGLLAIVLAFWRTDRSGLFWSCAAVQALPVIAGIVLSYIQDGTADMIYAAYGTFSAWFVFMAIAMSKSQRSDLKAAIG